MSLTLLGWLLVVITIAISALLLVPPRSRGSRKEQLDLETCDARVGEIGAETEAARPSLPSRLRSSRWGFGHLRGAAGALILAAAAFLLVAGVGAVTSYVGDSPEATGSGDKVSFSQSRAGSDGEMLARLTDYTRSIGTEEPASTAAADERQPDVNAMIERLAAALKTTPEDIEGWRMLGWSYFHTARYEQAATAYARAVELDPGSAELKLSYEEAKGKASERDSLETASSLQAEAVGEGGVEKITKSEAMPPREHDAAIRSTVDGLADRLESSPRDIEGWTLLMRSRVVLGERDVAARAFRKALEVFKDDSAASGEITAVAIELGLKAATEGP